MQNLLTNSRFMCYFLRLLITVSTIIGIHRTTVTKKGMSINR